MKYIEERYKKTRVNQNLERLGVTSLFLGLVIIIIGIALQLVDNDYYYNIGIIVFFLGFGVIVIGVLFLINAYETLEKKYNITEIEEES